MFVLLFLPFFCFGMVGADKPNLSTKRWNHQANKSLHDCHGPSLYSTNKWKETPSNSDFPKLKQKVWLAKNKTENLSKIERENQNFQTWKKKSDFPEMKKKIWLSTLGWDRGVSVAAIYEFPETVVPIWGSSGCSFIPLISSNHHTLSLSKDSNFPERERGWNDTQHKKLTWFTSFYSKC